MPRKINTFGDRGQDREIDALWQEIQRVSGLVAPASAVATPTLKEAIYEHPASGVTPGSYLSPDVTIDEFGHITAAATGAVVTEVTTARDSATMGLFSTLDARLEAMEAFIMSGGIGLNSLNFSLANNSMYLAWGF